MSLEKLSSNKAFEGELVKYKFKVKRSPLYDYLHAQNAVAYILQSEVLGGLDTQFNIFIPANASKGKVPVLVYLSGLTCTEDNA